MFTITKITREEADSMTYKELLRVPVLTTPAWWLDYVISREADYLHEQYLNDVAHYDRLISNDRLSESFRQKAQLCRDELVSTGKVTFSFSRS